MVKPSFAAFIIVPPEPVGNDLNGITVLLADERINDLSGKGELYYNEYIDRKERMCMNATAYELLAAIAKYWFIALALFILVRMIYP